MTSKHQAFWEKHDQEKNHFRQLLLMKDYMLSLSAEDLTDFMDEPIRSLTQAAKEKQLTPDQRKRLMKMLDDFIELKAPQLA
ncbi:MAG: hypothetical protein AAB316_16905 [Bacteroidota bacterium]